ncbi:MAG TPA: universal stress protein [Candidatus Binataceae bacterium]|nr:universal stress protein [Candidatus Binataceae bacterium]
MDAIFTKILCPVDLDHSFHALDFAAHLAQRMNSRILVFNVAAIPLGATEVAASGIEEYPYWELANRDKIRQLAEQKLAGRVDYETDVRSGEPVAAILKRAAEYGADLIVLATHGRKGLSHLLLGSVTEAVVRGASCPVLTIRPH